MHIQHDRNSAVGYVVSTWPRLSQTFVLNEILALERLGLPIRIYSTKDPDGEPVHARVASVRAPVTYLSLHTHLRAILRSNLNIAWNQPGRYLKNLFQAVRYRGSAIRCFFQAGYLADLLRRNPTAHLHAHFSTAPTLVAMFASELTGISYSFTAHARDIYVDTDPELLRVEMQCAKAVITVSEYNREHLLSQIDSTAKDKLQCIDYGLDLGQFPFRRPAPSDSGTPLILAVARLVGKKGLGDLIEAAQILRERGCSFHLEIIGSGPLEHVLRARVEELGLQNRVKLLGAQPQEMVRLAYQRAAIFALPCIVTVEGDRDGIPNVLLEAMASGVPVVSTPVSGIPELIEPERDGLLVAPNSPALLADALERLLRAPELRDSLARAARVKVEERFSIDRSSRQLLCLFQRGVPREEERADV